jgi:hypothetical protein
MIVALSVCQKDQALATKLLEWIVELSPQHPNILLLATPPGLNCSGLVTTAKRAFATVDHFEDATYIESDWAGKHDATGANMSFQCIANQIYYRYKEPWLWIEPDSTPLHPEWIKKIEAEYTAGKKLFMGDMVNFPPAGLHMSGIGVYPHELLRYAPTAMRAGVAPWDMVGSAEILQNFHETQLIQHEWLWDGQSPTFKSQEDLKKIHPETVIFHRCKDGSIIDRLREKTLGLHGEQGEPATVVSKTRHETQPQIFTYFEPTPDIDQEDEVELLKIWHNAWSAAGFIPVVLNESHARQHPMYSVASTIFGKWPSSNPKGYDRACGIRWLAFAMQGGGLVSDYDVMPNGFEIPKQDGMIFYSGNERDRLIPCLVYAPERSYYDSIIDHLITNTPTEKHWSDMISLRNFNFGIMDKQVKEYREVGWEHAKAIHFPTARMQPAGLMPKWKHIERLIPKNIEKESPILSVKDMIKDAVRRLSESVNGNEGRMQMARRELKEQLGIGAKGRPMKKKR